MLSRLIKFSMPLLGVLLISACGGSSAGVDEKKPISAIIAEAKNMTETQLKATAEKYKAAIEAKKPELEKLQAKLKSIPITQLMGKDAAALKNDITEITTSVKALTDRLNVYISQLKSMGADISSLKM